MSIGVLCTVLAGCGGDTLYNPEKSETNHAPGVSLSVSPMAGTAPVETTLQLSCFDPDQDPVQHFLDADGKPGFEVTQWEAISVERSYGETTEIGAICRDEKGAESNQITATVHVLNIATQRATILALTNDEREKVGAVALVEDQVLTEFAQAHARDMAERAYFSHTTPEGKTFPVRLEEAGITRRPAGENLALNYSPEGAVTAWINSSGHYQNMTNGQFRRIGIGVYSIEIEDQGRVYYVQAFTN